MHLRPPAAARLEVYITIAPLPVPPGSSLKIADHRKRHASIARQRLIQTQLRRDRALIAAPHQFELARIRNAVHSRLHIADAVNVSVQLDKPPKIETSGGESPRRLHHVRQLVTTHIPHSAPDNHT